MGNIDILISEEEINRRIEEIANQIDLEYGQEEIILVSILKGAAYFTIDLSKKMKNKNIILDFMKASSYGINNRETTGDVKIKLDISENIENKNVIIVEDILDSGITLDYIYKYLKGKNPKDVKICVLLNKNARRIKDIKADYIGFDIRNEFVLGYGLDYDEKYRNLPYIGYIKGE